MRLRSNQRAHGAQFELCTHRGGLPHSLEAHIDDVELGVGDDQPVDARFAASLDRSARSWRRPVLKVPMPVAGSWLP